MKILQVIDQLGPGGAERVCINIANLLHDNKQDVKLIVFNKIGPLFQLINKEIEIVVLESKKNKLKAYKKLIKEVKQADIVHIHIRKSFKFVKKTLLAFGVKKKLILHDHYGEIAVNKRIPTFYRSFYQPDFYIGCSKSLTSWATNIVGMNPKKVFFISNLVLKYNSNKPKDFDKKGIVLVGNLKPVKNHVFAVKLAKKLDLDLTIYTSKNENKYFKRLVKEIEEIYSKDRVHFMYNKINVQEDLFQYDFALNPSLSESGPLVLLEFLAQGLPFLTYNTGEIVKYVQSKFPDLVIDDFDMNTWEERVQTLNEIGENKLKEAFDDYNKENRFYESYMDVYKKCLE